MCEQSYFSVRLACLRYSQYGSPGVRMTVGSVLVDFDGTACPVDVAGELCRHFAAGDWEAHDEAVRRQEGTPRSAIDRQALMLSASREEMLRFVLGSFSVAPSFVTLVRWAESLHLPVAVVSDGFGFYIEPMLAAVGLDRVRVLTNRLVGSSPPITPRAPTGPLRLPGLRDLQDTRNHRLPHSSWAGRFRRRGPVRPLRSSLCRRRLRQGTTR